MDTIPQPPSTPEEKNTTPELSQNAAESHSALLWVIFSCFVVIIVILFAAYFFGFYPWKIKPVTDTATTLTNTNVATNTSTSLNTNGTVNTNSNSNTNTNTTNTNSSVNDAAPNEVGMKDATTAFVSTSGPKDGGPATLRKIPLDTPSATESLAEFVEVSYYDVYDDKVLYTSFLNTNVLYEYDVAAKTTKTLVTLESKHVFAGIKVSPDKTKLAYTDQCGVFCNETDNQNNTTTVVRMLDLQTMKNMDLTTEKGKAQGFKSVSGWLNNNTVMLLPGYEATEGALTFPQIELLNTTTKKITTFTLDPNARFFSAASNGTKIAYTTFTGDTKTQTHTSTLVVKYIDGSRTDVIETSNELEFREVFWMTAGSDEFNEGQLALMTSTVDSFTNELGYNVTGEKALYFSVEANWTMGRMASDSKPYWVLSAGVNHVVFTEKVNDNLIRVKVYNLQTGKTDTAIENIRSAYALPARFE